MDAAKATGLPPPSPSQFYMWSQPNLVALAEAQRLEIQDLERDRAMLLQLVREMTIKAERCNDLSPSA
jgi:hypothetical protein